VTGLCLERFEGHAGFAEASETGVAQLVTRRMLEPRTAARTQHDFVEALRRERPTTVGSLQHDEHERRLGLSGSLVVEIAAKRVEEPWRDRHDPLMFLLTTFKRCIKVRAQLLFLKAFCLES